MPYEFLERKKTMLYKKLKFVFISLLIALSIFPTATSVKAENNEYYRVIDSTTPFFQDLDTTELLFYLPYTYYVKVLGVSNNVAHIEYGNTGIDGYTYFDKLFLETQEVLNPYPTLTLKTNETTLLYADKSLSKSLMYIFPDRTLDFYGRVDYQNEYIYLVSYSGKLGYVKESALYPFSLENHPNPLTFLPSESPKPTPQENRLLTPFRIVIISCLLLAGIIALIISFKSKKSPNKIGDYYEEDFE